MTRITLILLFCSLCAGAQKPALYFEKINVQSGLSHNKANCIIQDKRGFIWIGTDDGLNRFDGHRFVQYRNKAGDSSTISGNIITDLLEDRQGIIWIATADGGLSRYDHRLPPAQQFKQYKPQPSSPGSIPVHTINTLIEDRFGALWLGTSGSSVLRFDKEKNTFHNVTKGGKTILDLCIDGNGLIWVGRHGGGIMKINPSSNTFYEDFRYRDLYAKLPHVTVTSIFRDNRNNIWFGSWDNQLYKQDVSTGKELSYGKQQGFQEDELSCFAQDPLGRIWMGGKEKGLQVHDPATGNFYQFTHDPSLEGSPADNKINCIFIDRQNRIWVGTDRGVSISNTQKQQLVQEFLTSPTGKKLVVYDFMEREREIWIGTSEGIYTRKEDGSTSLQKIFYRNIPLQVTSFYKGSEGQVYLGTDYSLFQYDPAHHTVQLLPNTEKDGVMKKLIESRIVSIIQTKVNGRAILMVAPYGHFLAYYDLEEKRWISRLDSSNILKRFNLKDNLIRKLFQDEEGRLWLATGKEGLAHWEQPVASKLTYYKNDPSNPSSISNDDVYDIIRDAKGNFWISTYGGGLQQFDPLRQKFTRINAANNLVEGLQLDSYGNVWMISNGSLHKYDPRRQAYTSFYLPDIQKTGGIRGRIFNDSKGRMYVAGTNFFVRFNPDSLQEVKEELKVHLIDFSIFNRSFSHLLQKESIQLTHKDNYFTFEFSAPSFSPGNKVYYSYQLEGFDEDWVDAGDRNYVSYSNLKGGDYRLKVRATTTPGSWGKSYEFMDLTVTPPFWKRSWFFILLGLVLTGAVYLIYRYRINELLKRQEIRNRIAQDLHDNVGSTLSSISVYSQVARIYQGQKKEAELNDTLEKISTTSSEMISELNDTVWAINPRNDHMDIILQRMDSFARPLLAARNISFELKAEPGIQTLNLEMEKRKNLYLIFKEAINNAIKYADCSKVDVSLNLKNRNLIMRIADNGRGFDLAKTSEGYKSSDAFGGGNGLRNMKRRAREMKGKLTVESEPARGTRVTLLFGVT